MMVLLLCVAASVLPAWPQGGILTSRPPKLELESHTLENGLRVIVLEEHSVPIVHLEVWYHVGSKDEQPGHTGFAHLFEHLMFKGSANVGAEEHSRIIEAVGGFDDAETTSDFTLFYETFPSNYLERVLWLEADRMGSLNVDEANFQSERNVVEEERRVRVDNRPYGLVEEDLYAAAFTVHGYHHTPIGSIEDLNKATLQDVREFHNTYYKPNNATIVIVGDFSSLEAVRWAKKYFQGVPQSAAPIPRREKPEPPQEQVRTVEKSYSNTPLPAVVEGYKMPAAFAADSYPLNIAADILSHGQSSRLYQKLVYKDRIAVEAAGFGNFTEDPNLFWVLAVMNQGHTVAEGQKELDEIVEQIKTQPVDPRELEKAKNQTISRFILGRQTDEAKAEAVGDAAVIGKDPNLVNTELDRYLKVTAADIERACQQYFVKQHATVLLVAPPQVAK
jgi:zinc protease